MVPKQVLVNQHASQHGGDKYRGLEITGTERDDCRAGAQARDRPARAKQHAADHKLWRDVPCSWQMKGVTKKCSAASGGCAHAHHGNGYRAHHHKGEAEVPAAR